MGPWYAGKSGVHRRQVLRQGSGRGPDLAAPAYAALEQALHAEGIRAPEAWAYNVRNIAGSSLPSLHSYGIAIDLDPAANPYVPWSGWHQTRFTPDQIAAVDAIVTTRGVRVWKWGGHWRPDADLMHFQIDCHPDELRQGIAGQSAVRRDTKTVSEIASTKRAAVKVELPYLSKGDKGTAVRSLQALLSIRSPLEVDGSFGKNTDTAVRAIQGDAALDVDGVVGPDTWRALLDM